MAISIDQLAAEITSAVQEYTEDVTLGIEKEIDSTSKEMVTKVKASSAFKDITGDYRKGWTRKKVVEGGEVTYIIYNKNKPSITHLLEKGHAKRGGGRVSAKPHIRPTYDKLIPQMEKNIEKIIRNGG